ncbi:MAG: hypothetical protein N4Q30_04950, partial [Neisseriaceae bacterium]|nr:hypothetical protein [Neisseriaceae bacterium]
MFYKIISLTCLSLVLVACSHDDLTHSSGLPKATKDSAEFKTNPHPQQAYKVKVQVNDAPG